MADDLPNPHSPRDVAALPGNAALVSGALAALVALGVGELVSGLAPQEQSLVAGVGRGFVELLGASVKDVAISVFGTNDKAALLVGVVLVAAVLGAGLGWLGRGRPWVVPAGLAGFGVLGLVAGWTDPLASPGYTLAATLCAVAAGVVTWSALTRVATGRPLRRVRPVVPAMGDAPPSADPVQTVTEYPTNPASTRRSFLGWAAGAGAVAVVSATAGRLLASRGEAERARAAVRLPPVRRGAGGTVPPAADAPLGVPGLTPYYVPNKDFYLIDTALVKPQVDPATWRLRIGGLVDRPFELTFDELLALPQVEEAVTLSCVSNEVGGDLVGNARWQGVLLADLLERAGVQPAGTQILGVSVDGFTAGFPTAAGLDGRVALVAVGMNGEPLPIAHGFPARLVVSGLYGYVSATKWLQEIRLTPFDSVDGYWIPRGWSKEAPVKTQSRIDVPRSSDTLAPGPTTIAGVAWAPDVGISRVEVQVDNGEWREARLAEVVSDNTWVQWLLDWDAPAGNHRVRVRATDANGVTQTEAKARPDPSGATGWHTIDVGVDT